MSLKGDSVESPFFVIKVTYGYTPNVDCNVGGAATGTVLNGPVKKMMHGALVTITVLCPCRIGKE